MMAQSPRNHLADLLADFDVAMLVTVTPEGAPHARPMHIASKEPDADLWFVTAAHSGKVGEIQQDSQVAVTMQDASRYLSISGKAVLVRDRAKIEQLWQESWRVWFPEGKDDPDLALLKIDSGTAEFWDNSGSLKLKYLFRAGKAYLQGDVPQRDESIHARVKI